MVAERKTIQGQHLSVPYREVFTAMPAPLVVLDADLLILDVSDAYLMMLGLQREALLGRYLFDVFPASEEAAEDAVTAESVLREAIASGTSQYLPVFQYDTETEPGSGVFDRRWWRMTATPLLGEDSFPGDLGLSVGSGGAGSGLGRQARPDGGDSPFQAVLYRLDEVTEAVVEQGRTAAAEAAVVDLTGREARLVQVVESLASAFATLDSSWRITYANAAFGPRRRR